MKQHKYSQLENIQLWTQRISSPKNHNSVINLYDLFIYFKKGQSTEINIQINANVSEKGNEKIKKRESE